MSWRLHRNNVICILSHIYLFLFKKNNNQTKPTPSPDINDQGSESPTKNSQYLIPDNAVERPYPPICPCQSTKIEKNKIKI
jgi:hypothetical protein